MQRMGIFRSCATWRQCARVSGSALVLSEIGGFPISQDTVHRDLKVVADGNEGGRLQMRTCLKAVRHIRDLPTATDVPAVRCSLATLMQLCRCMWRDDWSAFLYFPTQARLTGWTLCSRRNRQEGSVRQTRRHTDLSRS